MYLKEIHIQNFKSLKDVTLQLNLQLNVFTGINNSGKTTLLEALSLWNECFYKLITTADRAITNLSLTKGEYKLGYAPKTSQSYFDYLDIQSIRTTSYHDIFYNLDAHNTIHLAVTLEHDKRTLGIEFLIEKSSGSNYHIHLANYKTFDYRLFNTFFSKFPHPIKTIFASPIAKLEVLEEFKSNPQIEKSIEKRDSASVFRNRLDKVLQSRDGSASRFINDIALILSDNEESIEFLSHFHANRDTHIAYNISIGAKDISKNLSLLGSGTLQIIEILLALYESKKDLNIILLDEPDSHIHRDIQKRLIRVLEQSSQNTQIFISTHNESLIRSSRPSQVFHLEKTHQSKTYKPIVFDRQEYVAQGLIPSKHLKVLQDLGNESALDFINALEADRLVFVEGKHDPKYIEFILDKYTDVGESARIAYWSFEGIDNMLKHIFSYKEVFLQIKNDTSLWEKSVLIFDRDYFTDRQATNLQTQLHKKLDIPVHIWNFYTIESVFLSHKEVFAKLIAKVLPSDVPLKEVVTSLEEQINVIVNEKLQWVGSEAFKEVNGWMKAKEKLLEKNSLKGILSDTAYADIQNFHREQLEAKELKSLASKEDIEQIIQNVIKQYDEGIEALNCFELLLSKISKHTLWFEEWNTMIGKINR